MSELDDAIENLRALTEAARQVIDQYDLDHGVEVSPSLWVSPALWRRRQEWPGSPPQGLQAAFVAEARMSMGAPDRETVEGLEGRPVVITFNDRSEPAFGILGKIRENGMVELSDGVDEAHVHYFLNSIESISPVDALPAG